MPINSSEDDKKLQEIEKNQNISAQKKVDELLKLTMLFDIP